MSDAVARRRLLLAGAASALAAGTALLWDYGRGAGAGTAARATGGVISAMMPK